MILVTMLWVVWGRSWGSLSVVSKVGEGAGGGGRGLQKCDGEGERWLKFVEVGLFGMLRGLLHWRFHFRNAPTTDNRFLEREKACCGDSFVRNLLHLPCRPSLAVLNLVIRACSVLPTNFAVAPTI